jgi:hypothetical protein
LRCADRDCGDTHMLFLVGVAILLIACGITHRMSAPGGAGSSDLGFMSEQWLAEYRASHP